MEPGIYKNLFTDCVGPLIQKWAMDFRAQDCRVWATRGILKMSWITNTVKLRSELKTWVKNSKNATPRKVNQKLKFSDLFK